VDFRNATFHAEEAAVRRVRNPRGTVLYVARVNVAGEPVMARPCPRCQRLLAAVGVAGAYFTTWDGSVDYLALS
jgi:cytidine deaminase